MPRTHSKGAAGSAAAADKKSAASKPSASIYNLPAESDNPPKLFVLPNRATPAARIVTLHHPRYARPARYFVCPEAGFFEFTAVAPPKPAPRSWLLQPSDTPSNDSDGDIKTQIAQSLTLHLATPFDPLFLLLPALFSTSSQHSSSDTPPPRQRNDQEQKKKRMFLALDDHLDALPDPARHLATLLSTTSPASAGASTRALLEARLAAVCDVVQAGDESMYRVSEARVAEVLWRKAEVMVDAAAGEGRLPVSMEERFVRRELEAPVLDVRRRAAVERSDSGTGSGSGSGTPGEEESSAVESQASVTTTSSSSSVESAGTEVSAASTAATSVAAEGEEDGEDGAAAGGEDVASAIKASEEVVRLQRLRVAFNFICSRYVAPAIAETLKHTLAKATDLVDFAPLDEYLARLAKLRQEAAAARSTDFSRKRTADDEEEDERAEKRRKKEAEEKAKKASMSRGVKELMKVNTSGMRKMSDFFKKKR